MKHFYEKDIFISKDIAAKINKACSLSYPEDWFSENELHSPLPLALLMGW